MRFREHLLVVFSAALIAVLVSAAPAVAQVQWTDDELAQFSDIVAHGNVIAVESRWDYEVDAIYTYVTVELRDVLKGDEEPGELVEIKQLGGRVGNLVLGIGGQAYFEVGEEAVFFLETRPRDDTYYTAGLWQGKFRVQRSPDNPDGIAVRSTADMQAAAGEGEGTSFDVDSRVLRPWKEELRARAAARARAPGDRQFDPFDMPALPEVPTFTDWFDGVVLAGLEEDDDDDVGSASDEFKPLHPNKPRWEGGTVASTYHRRGERLTPGKGFDQIEAAAATWKHRKSSIAIVPKKGGVPKKKGCSFSRQADKKILVSFKDRCTPPKALEISGASDGGEISNTGATLGIGGGWWFIGAPFSSFQHGFVITNSDHPGFKAFFRAILCFQALILHEYGHAIGLGHTPKAKAIMFPTTSFPACKTIVPKLGGDDKRAIKKTYPKPFK